MSLTIHDVARHLRYEQADMDIEHLQMLLDVSTQAVQNYVMVSKFDLENKTQQQAILLLCGYYDQFRNAEQEMPSDDGQLPPQVRALLAKYYSPIVC